LLLIYKSSTLEWDLYCK